MAPDLIRLLVFKSETILPDILKYVPLEKMQDFLIAFGNQTVTFPSWEELEKCMRDAYIIKCMRESPQPKTTSKKLAKELNMEADTVHNRYQFLKKLLSTDE